MTFRFAHNNINVIDLERSLAFYEEALGLVEVRRKEASDGSYTIVFLGDGESAHKLELTWLRDWEKESYNLGDNEFHLAFETDDLEAARAKHRQMDCIIYENKAMGIYFIVDPDGYWLEIVPTKR
jgi:lactoylglutathione lyase